MSQKSEKSTGTASSEDPRYNATPAQKAEYKKLRAQGVNPVAARQAALKVKK